MALVPAIKQQARVAFRHMWPEPRDEAIQEVVVNACVAYHRLVELGKADLTFRPRTIMGRTMPVLPDRPSHVE